MKLIISLLMAVLIPMQAPDEAPVEELAQEPVKTIIENMYVNISSINIREAPTTESAVLAVAYYGDTVSIINKSNPWGWYLIRTAKGMEGYMSKNYLTTLPPDKIRLKLLEDNLNKMKKEAVSMQKEQEELNAIKTQQEQTIQHLSDNLAKEKAKTEGYMLRLYEIAAEYGAGVSFFLGGMFFGYIMGRRRKSLQERGGLKI